MSDPHQATSSSVSMLLESLLGDVDEVADVTVRDHHQCYNSSSLEYLSSENGWADWDDVVDFGTPQSAVRNPFLELRSLICSAVSSTRTHSILYIDVDLN